MSNRSKSSALVRLALAVRCASLPALALKAKFSSGASTSKSLKESEESVTSSVESHSGKLKLGSSISGTASRIALPVSLTPVTTGSITSSLTRAAPSFTSSSILTTTGFTSSLLKSLNAYLSLDKSGASGKSMSGAASRIVLPVSLTNVVTSSLIDCNTSLSICLPTSKRGSKKSIGTLKSPLSMSKPSGSS